MAIDRTPSGEPAANLSPLSEGRGPTLVGRRILVAEDSGIEALNIMRMLDDFKCRMIGPARSVRYTLDLLRRYPEIDGAIVDLTLEDSKAFPAIDELQRLQIPFVLVTGLSAQDLAPPYNKAAILSKPFTIADLRKALEAMVPRMRAK